MSELLTGSAGERRLFLGNEAIVRGALEAGVALVTTYPGTPASEIGDRCYEIARQTDLQFEFSTNEKVALEVAAGAAACGWRVLCAMKHVGLNVAADALMTLAYVGVKGGMVIVSADDPSLFSSQNEQDNRYYAKLAGLPMLEPATPEEAKAMTLAAFALSEELKVPVLLRTTTRVNHTRGPVTLGELAARPGPGRFHKDPFRQVMVPAVARQAHVRLLAAQDQARALAETSAFNEISGRGDWGIVTSGVAGTYVADALRELGLADQVRLLKLGFTHPLPEALLGDFLAPLTKVLGGGGTGAVPGRGSQGRGPDPGAHGDHPGQRSGPLFPPLRIPPGPGAGGDRPVFRGGLGGVVSPGPREDPGAAPAGPPPQSLRRVSPPGHVLCGENRLKGPGGGRESSPRTSAATPWGSCRPCPWPISSSAWGRPSAPPRAFPGPRARKWWPSSATPPSFMPVCRPWSTPSTTDTIFCWSSWTTAPRP